MVTGGLRAMARCDALGEASFSDMEGGLYRGYLSPAYARAQRQLAAWMEEAGMAARVDQAGNLVGRYEGKRDGPALLIGSHLDSVRDGGRYDGPLGIMLGVECVAALHAEGRRLPFPIEVYAFGDEEGSRFPAAMLTSRAVAGTLDAASLDLHDAAGVSLKDALATLGLSKADFVSARHGPALAYLEAHIEQGPVLEAEALAVGTVTGIAAQLRYAITVTGRAGHAGTTAMPLRRDALAAAAAMISKAEAIARAGAADLVATVGSIEALPGAANVVPGEVRFMLDVRAARDVDRDAAAGAIRAGFEAIARERGVGYVCRPLQDLPASPCDPALMALMDAAIAEIGLTPFRLVSGAGHDAMILAALCPTTMLFIRCEGGVSHNPDERVTGDDCEIAFRAMRGFIDRLGATIGA
jgi:allantoate deiminase